MVLVDRSIHDFSLNSDKSFEEFIKAQMKEQLGMVEDPTLEQIQQIIENRKTNFKAKGKTVYFKDFIKERADFSDYEDIDIIDVEIVKERINKIKNE
jgi:hypothetical protein